MAAAGTSTFLRPPAGGPLAGAGGKPPKRELTAEEAEELKYAFDSLDYEQLGSVTPAQVKVALRAMGFPVKKADVMDLLRRHGEDESERLEYEAFRKVVADKVTERTPADDMLRAFHLFDVNKQGKLDVPTMRKVVKSLGLDIPEAELQAMVDEFDHDRDGMISQQEFMAILTEED